MLHGRKQPKVIPVCRSASEVCRLFRRAVYVGVRCILLLQYIRQLCCLAFFALAVPFVICHEVKGALIPRGCCTRKIDKKRFVGGSFMCLFLGKRIFVDISKDFPTAVVSQLSVSCL